MSSPAQAPRHVADGRIFMREYDPVWPDSMKVTAGGILLPDSAVDGSAIINKNGDMLKPDKRTIYGVVTGCGFKANRTTTERLPMDQQKDFPLPVKTLVKLSRAVDHRISPGEESQNTWDLHEYLLPGEYRNPEVWGEGPQQEADNEQRRATR